MTSFVLTVSHFGSYLGNQSGDFDQTLQVSFILCNIGTVQFSCHSGTRISGYDVICVSTGHLGYYLGNYWAEFDQTSQVSLVLGPINHVPQIPHLADMTSFVPLVHLFKY